MKHTARFYFVAAKQFNHAYENQLARTDFVILSEPCISVADAAKLKFNTQNPTWGDVVVVAGDVRIYDIEEVE